MSNDYEFMMEEFVGTPGSYKVAMIVSRLEKAEQEIARLKRGEFTEEEFQNLCHNFSEEDKCKFKKGCELYQNKLFGENK